MDATADDSDKHNAGDHDGGIKGNNGDDGLNVTCNNGDGVDAGKDGIKGKDACMDVTINDDDGVVVGNDGINNDGDGVNSGNNDNNDDNEGNKGNNVVEGNDGDKGNDGDNRFDCTSVNHPGPCGWKIAHQCICKDLEVPIQWKGNLNESCLCLVHPECMWLWECSLSAITPVDALSQFNFVCPMHHPHYKIPYKSIDGMSDMQYLKQRNYPSLPNSQTLTQPPTSKKTVHPNEKSSSSLVGHLTARHLTALLIAAIVTVIAAKATKTRDQSGSAELLPEKDSSPMIKGMDIMASESAKHVFNHDKLKYSSSEHLERYRQIQISRGMDPTFAVPSANRSDASINSRGRNLSPSSNSSGSSLSSSAVGTDTSQKTPVATIVDGYRFDGDDGDQCDSVDNGHVAGNDDSDKERDRNEGNDGNDSDKGNGGDDNKDGGNDNDYNNDYGNDENEGNDGNDSNKGNDGDDDKDGDNGNDATDFVILDCAAGTQCKAPFGANLADSPHSCWGCNKKSFVWRLSFESAIHQFILR